MCGIVGIAATFTVRDRGWLVAGRDAIRHRGPDGMGEWWSADGQVGLGHRRLAVIDLTEQGHQPMANEDGSNMLVFNGEIYNFLTLKSELVSLGHRFRSNSDTEVILEAYQEWGIECVTRLVGMFAFALVDNRKRIVILARDRAGEKPLFYHQSNGTLRFGSELKALLADTRLPRRFNLLALDCYLSLGYVPGNQCILDGFRKLPAAHVLTFDFQNGATKLKRYWALPELQSKCATGKEAEDDLLDDLELALEQAVSQQLVADVPVGILLSGGVDSSLVTAMASRVASTVQTFTIRFPGHKKYDETAHARLIANHFGTSHNELDAEPATVDFIPRLAQQCDEPIADSSIIPTYLLSQLVRKKCTVALGGDGGDELFGGYPHYSRLLWMQSRMGLLPRWIREAVASGSEYLLPVGARGRNWLQTLGHDLERSTPLVAAHFDQNFRASILSEGLRSATRAEAHVAANAPKEGDLLQRATRLDFSNYLAEDILVKVDRASMLNSLEMRAPFLDHHLIEFAYSRVPSRLKATSSGRKILLKRLAARLLPREFDQHRKQGFSLPLASWLQSGKFREFFDDVLLGSANIYDKGAIQTLLRHQDKGRNNAERLFSLVMLEVWRREYSVSP